ncbi:uncharacterized protein [Misgurnus anguillicaudatus]|uniref:uncharacterized protein isoform X2 n=1 Tax=Misgurnus anguillicaudatus TaxID=75329 RepID=UPI003CCF5B84
MFGSVRKMISIFESQKQSRPVSFPPSLSLSRTRPRDETHNSTSPILRPIPPPTDSEPHHPPYAINLNPRPGVAPSPARQHLCPKEQMNSHVTLRKSGSLQPTLRTRVRESWPSGAVDFYPRAFRLAVSMGTKEPIGSKHLLHTCARNKRRDPRLDVATVSRSSVPQSDKTCSSKPINDTKTARAHSSECPSEISGSARQTSDGNACGSLTSDKQPVVCTAPAAGSGLRTDPVSSSCRSGPFGGTDQRSLQRERGGASTRKQRLRPSDSSLLSLLLFFHSGTNSSMVAIDNKIEQAMDLVKSHLMMAVREEVEILREQIKELSERNAQLERENYILRALRDKD